MTWSRRPFWKKFPKRPGATSVSTSKPKNTGTHQRGLWWGEPPGAPVRATWASKIQRLTSLSFTESCAMLEMHNYFIFAMMLTKCEQAEYSAAIWTLKSQLFERDQSAGLFQLQTHSFVSCVRVLCIGRSTLWRKSNKPKRMTSGSKHRSFFRFMSLQTYFCSCDD